jgi:hypothetical protein
MNTLLNYVSTSPEAVIRFYAISMQLTIESNALYLSVSKAQAGAAGYFYLTATPAIENTTL